jgi:hypothetical protein
MAQAAFSPQTNSDHYTSSEQLGDRITQLSAHLDAGTYQLLTLIGEFDAGSGWNGEGILSCAKK